jgi:uncharacterized membrane protein
MSQNNAPNNHAHNHLTKTRQFIRSLKTREDEKRTLAEKFADFMTALFGSTGFLVVNVVWFSLWIIVNVGLLPGVQPFDPFPFGFLTMIVSLEAIVLAIFVLISQNRSSKIADLREEIDLQIDMLTEREVTKIMHLFGAIAEKQGIDLSHDRELAEMLEPTSTGKIEQALEEQVLGEKSHHPSRS